MQVATSEMVKVRCLTSAIVGNNMSLYKDEETDMPADEALRHANARHVEILENVSDGMRKWSNDKLGYQPPKFKDGKQTEHPRRSGKQPN